MYTTIEPRLIELLNTELPSPSYSHPSLDLPPLHDPNILKSSGRPPPLEPDASKRSGKFERSLDIDPQLQNLIKGINGEDNEGNNNTKRRPSKNDSGRALGISSPQSLRKILGDVNEGTSTPSKKRSVPASNKDDFVQLPQPVKKHKATKQVVPPIIIGLFEPPPQAALFPPIASSSFHDSHGRNTLNTFPPPVTEPREGNSRKGKAEGSEGAGNTEHEPSKKKPVRPRKKWTESETNNLLLGVSKHGVGNWTDILTDTAFTFNKRSGADLKDRFRTCCPSEWRNQREAAARLKKGKSSAGIVVKETSMNDDNVEDMFEDDSAQSRKSKAHRKKLEDLAQLGIEGPFRKSLRRERRPFTEQEDEWILMGYYSHGPAWTKIQRDPRFHLQSRQPTDLRDRFRNKYPEKFCSEREKEKERERKEAESKSVLSPNSSFGSTNSQKPTSSAENSNKLPPASASSSQDSEKHSIPISAQPPPARDGLTIQEILSTTLLPMRGTTSSQQNLKDILVFPDSSQLDSDTLPFTQGFDWANPIAAPMGEMEISRLLLEETWPDLPGKERQTYTNINSIISANVETNAFYGLLDEERETWGEA